MSSHKLRLPAAVAVLLLAASAPAAAQRVHFDRTFDASALRSLDASTVRGKIEITAGEPGRVVVSGDATVRVSWNTPANAAEIARQVAAQPPIVVDGDTLRLTPPPDGVPRKAVTVSYVVRVPPGMDVAARSDSGAITIAGVSGTAAVRTQSAAIVLSDLRGDATVTTGSGAVSVDGAEQALAIATASSAVKASRVRGPLSIRTQSGALEASLLGEGDVDVRSGSSAITLHGVRGALAVSSSSGRILVSGEADAAWQVSSGSGSVELMLERDASFSLDATSGSGSVRAENREIDGTIGDRRVIGTVGTGGPLIQVSSRSGSVRIR